MSWCGYDREAGNENTTDASVLLPWCLGGLAWRGKAPFAAMNVVVFKMHSFYNLWHWNWADRWTITWILDWHCYHHSDCCYAELLLINFTHSSIFDIETTDHWAIASGLTQFPVLSDLMLILRKQHPLLIDGSHQVNAGVGNVTMLQKLPWHCQKL